MNNVILNGVIKHATLKAYKNKAKQSIPYWDFVIRTKQNTKRLIISGACFNRSIFKDIQASEGKQVLISGFLDSFVRDEAELKQIADKHGYQASKWGMRLVVNKLDFIEFTNLSELEANNGGNEGE